MGDPRDRGIDFAGMLSTFKNKLKPYLIIKHIYFFLFFIFSFSKTRECCCIHGVFGSREKQPSHLNTAGVPGVTLKDKLLNPPPLSLPLFRLLPVVFP